MACEVVVSDEFRAWYEPLSEAEQLSLGRVIGLLEDRGTALAFPYSSGFQGSKLSHMRELRIQHEGRPCRVLYAFDPTRNAYLPLGGGKTGDLRWYGRAFPGPRAFTQSISKNSSIGFDRPREAPRRTTYGN